MPVSAKNQKRFAVLIILAVLALASPIRAEDPLPAYAQIKFKTPLAEVGSGTYRKYGFRVYNASLWAPKGIWDSHKPYALEIAYTRSVSKDTLLDTVLDNIKEQNVADDATLAQWKETLGNALPDVEDGDVIIGVSVPGKKSLLLFNGKEIASIDDPVLSKAFFNIWLGDHADENLRTRLLGGRKSGE